jgi:hypothetical protein
MTNFPQSPTGYPQTARRPHRGTMILVFGILAWFVCFIFGIMAWVMGNNDLKEMDAGRMDPEGRGLTQAGKILGMINVILLLCSLAITALIVIGMLVLGVFAAAASQGGP